jgi:hypothetical protein
MKRRLVVLATVLVATICTSLTLRVRADNPSAQDQAAAATQRFLGHLATDKPIYKSGEYVYMCTDQMICSRNGPIECESITNSSPETLSSPEPDSLLTFPPFCCTVGALREELLTPTVSHDSTRPPLCLYCLVLSCRHGYECRTGKRVALCTGRETCVRTELG